MLDDETRRHKIAGELMGRLAGTGAFKVTSLEGERPFMVAFDGERISDVFARIAYSCAAQCGAG